MTGIYPCPYSVPPFGYCDTCGAPLWDLTCTQCGEVYD